MAIRPLWRRLRRVLRIEPPRSQPAPAGGRRSPEPDREVDAELRYHLEERVRDYIARGMDPEAARNASLARLGDLDRVRNECTGLIAAERRTEERRTRLATSWLDVKLGVRMLVKHPGLSLVAGLGMAVAVAFTIGPPAFLNAHVYPRLPLEEGDRIVALQNWDLATNNGDRHSLHDFVMWRAEMKSVVETSAFRGVERRVSGGDGLRAVVNVAEMTASGFRLARVPARLGRHLVEEDERDGAPPVVVIGHDVWRTRFGQDRSVIGQEIRIGETPHTIVGVMPDGFGFPFNHQYWTPLRANRSDYARREGPELFVFGRLAPSATLESAGAELATIGRRAAVAFPETHAQLRPQILPYTWPLIGIQRGDRPGMFHFQLMLTLVLVVVALNIAVLVYARTATRRGEIAVRTALGASRSRIVTQLFVEALVLSMGPALLGLWIVHALALPHGGQILEQLTGGAPFWTDYGARPGTALHTIGLVALAAAIIGVLPALQATGRRIQSDIRQLGGGTGMRLGKMWTVLIVVQVAIAVAALPIAVRQGLSVLESEGALTRPTFPVDEFLIAGLAIEDAPDLEADAAGQHGSPSFLGGRLPELIRRLRADPDIADVTFTTSLPGRTGWMWVEIDGVSAPTQSPSGPWAHASGVGPEYLDVLGARILTGRGFEPRDLGDASGVVIVNRSFVRNVLGGGNAVGRRIRYRTEPSDRALGETEVGPWYEIVGVASDLYANMIAPERVPVDVYHPVAPTWAPGASLTLLLHLRRSASPVDARKLGTIAAEVDPALQLVQVRRGADENAEQQLILRLVTVLVLLIMMTVLVLSAAGVYALMSFTVTRRRKEIGIRSALGASPYRVLLSLFSRVASQIGVGVVVGIAGAIVLERFTGSATTAARAPFVVPAIALLMAVVGFFAAFGPARRGLRIDPSEALRAEQ